MAHFLNWLMDQLKRDQYIEEGIGKLDALNWFDAEVRSRLPDMRPVIVGTPHDSRAQMLHEMFDRGSITGDEYEAALHAWPLPRKEQEES